jgi:hypothetical protein
MSSKREIKKLAKIVREELRYLQTAVDNHDMRWAETHAQQAAGMAATLEQAVVDYAQWINATPTKPICHVTPLR